MSSFSNKIVEKKAYPAKATSMHEECFKDNYVFEEDVITTPLTNKQTVDVDSDKESSGDKLRRKYGIDVVCEPPVGTAESMRPRQLLIIAVSHLAIVNSFSCHLGWPSAQRVEKLCQEIQTLIDRDVQLEAQCQLYHALRERLYMRVEPIARKCVVAFEDIVYTTKTLIPEDEIEKWRVCYHNVDQNGTMQSNTYVIRYNHEPDLV